jgi:hypothetical protein
MTPSYVTIRSPVKLSQAGTVAGVALRDDALIPGEI